MNYNNEFSKYFINNRCNTCNIVFEGLDGSGKSARSNEMYNYLVKELDNNKFNINIYNHPSSDICKEERNQLLNNNNDPKKEVEILNKCKNKLTNHIIKNTDSNKFNINIIDRWVYSTFVYQNLMDKQNHRTYKNSDISNIINNDIKNNPFLIDIVILNDISFINFYNRIVNGKNADAKEKMISKIGNFNTANKIYHDIIKNVDLHKRFIILDKSFYYNPKEFINMIINELNK